MAKKQKQCPVEGCTNVTYSTGKFYQSGEKKWSNYCRRHKASDL